MVREHAPFCFFAAAGADVDKLRLVNSVLLRVCGLWLEWKRLAIY